MSGRKGAKGKTTTLDHVRVPCVPLSGGVGGEMPILAFGTQHDQVAHEPPIALASALSAGYKAFDAGPDHHPRYHDVERTLGSAIQKTGPITRRGVFLSSKVRVWT